MTGFAVGDALTEVAGGGLKARGDGPEHGSDGRADQDAELGHRAVGLAMERLLGHQDRQRIADAAQARRADEGHARRIGRADRDPGGDGGPDRREDAKRLADRQSDHHAPTRPGPRRARRDRRSAARRRR
ncbi:MAG: hypothetical protein WDM85_02760 [Caulobacteraceae bacterium]